jgi:hypothetical protein
LKAEKHTELADWTWLKTKAHRFASNGMVKKQAQRKVNVVAHTLKKRRFLILKKHDFAAKM